MQTQPASRNTQRTVCNPNCFTSPCPHFFHSERDTLIDLHRNVQRGNLNVQPAMHNLSKQLILWVLSIVILFGSNGVIAQSVIYKGISIANFTGGSVSASSPSSPDGSAVQAGETVTLKVTCEKGYQLAALVVFETNAPSNSLPLDNGTSFVMPDYGVTITAMYSNDDSQDIIAAVQAIENASFTDTQENISTKALAKSKVESVINALNLDGITTNIIDDTFVAAVEGSVQNINGTDGSYTFKVEVSKGSGTTQKTTELTLTITATHYDNKQDNEDINSAKLAVINATYTATQAEAQNSSQAKAKVEALINTMPLYGVIFAVEDGEFIAPVAGTVADLNGTDGSYTFTVRLNKGAGAEVTTDVLKLDITATPYDPANDNNDITTAKGIIEATSFSAPQAIVTDIISAKAAVEVYLNNLTLNGVETTVVDGVFSQAIAGTLSTPNGTNGSYTFKVELNKGAGTQQETNVLTLTITATPYTPPNTYNVTIALCHNGSVTASPDHAVEENETVTLTASPALGYETDDIQAYNSNDDTETVTLTGSGNTRTFEMPAYDVTVEATFKKTADQEDVEDAIGLINSMNHVVILQSVANTQTSVKAALVPLINNLPGMNATGITVTAENITINNFTEAIAGTPSSQSGVDGSFSFTVTLKKTNSAMVTSIAKTGDITATAYDPTQDNADIEAAKKAVLGATYTATQTEVQNLAQAKGKVMSIIGALNLHGVTPTVVNGAFAEAVAGAIGTPAGTNGSYKFTVKLNKSGGTEVITGELTLTITATPYNPAQDNAAITAAKALIEGTTFLTSQVNAPNIASAHDVVVSKLSALSLNGVTTVVNDINFVAAVAGTAGTTAGTNGSYKFTVALNKGWGAQQTTSEMTLSITATPFAQTDQYIYNIKPTTHGTVTADKPNPVTENTTVTLTVTPAEGYELDVLKAYKTGDETVVVTLTGANTFTMPAFGVTVEATFKKTTDQTSVESALALVNGMSLVSILQATANTETAVKTELVQIISNLSGMSATGVTVVANNIAISDFIAATAGTSSNLSGNNGSFAFTVTLKKNNSASLTSSTKPGVIIATEYDTTQDNLDIAAAKTTIEGAAYTAIQAHILNSAYAKAKVESSLSGLSLNGVTTEVIGGQFVAASEGTVASPNGTNGSYKFTVKLNKGAGTQVITAELTLIITATPYDATQDNADITATKLIIEGANFITSQINAPDIAKAKAVVEKIISVLPLRGVTTTVNNGVFTGAVAGASGTPSGTNGTYTFTVNLSKGAGTTQTTSSLTLIITATPHTQAGEYILNIFPSLHGTVTTDKANPVAENESVTLTAVPAAGYQLSTVTAVKANDELVTVTLNGTGNSRTFTMPDHDVSVNAAFTKTAAQLEVETAIGLINGLSNMSVPQETANTETDVKTWLASQINALPAILASGITVNTGDITVSGFSAAETGIVTNQMGTNGGFRFFVTLSKTGSAEVSSHVKNGVIIATPFAGIKYNVTITPSNNGTVTANQTQVTVGTTVTLTITPSLGYALNTISAIKTGDASITVQLSGSSATRQLVMPAYNVTVIATFQKTAEQLAVEAAKTAVENMHYLTVSQSVANNEGAVRTWLARQINALPVVSGNGIVVTANNITVSSFRAAIGGTPSSPIGTDGAFTFTVTLTKGSNASATTTGKSGIITATEYFASSYSIYISTTVNGVVSADREYAPAGTTITLSIIPNLGYELESLTANPTVTFTGSGNTRTFVMPANYLIISATFKKTQAQSDLEALEAVKTAIEGGAYRIAQGTGNSATTIRTWLVSTLGVMFGNPYNVQLRSAGDPIIGDVTVTTLTAAVEGTTANPQGTNGTFAFTVALQLGQTLLATTITDGTIIALPYTGTPMRRIELLKLNALATRILNTGNVATGELNLQLTGANADAFFLPSTTLNSIAVGSETDVVLTLRSGLTVGEYKATLVVSGEGFTSKSLDISYMVTPTGNDNLPVKTLRAWMQNNVLHVTGLTPGQTLSVYSLSGVLIYRSAAASEEASIPLPSRGFYIITSGAKTVKILF